MSINYVMRNRAMILSEQTSRACGYLADIDGETPDGRASYRARVEVRTDAQTLANTLGDCVEIYASHPAAPVPWVVDVIGPMSPVRERARARQVTTLPAPADEATNSPTVPVPPRTCAEEVWGDR
ncbi:MAG TPA: hypothetical protein VMN56_01385 [Casimicrobiaceae bacterium]|nr:hypothetical protein [Casimicrobiaceae bacterium]